MSSSSRKIAYVLGAGFSYGTGHKAKIGHGLIEMPLQNTLFEELCTFQHKKIRYVHNIARSIRQYFNPNAYRSKRKRGRDRHKDLFGLSIEEIVTFFDELIRTEHQDREKIEEVIKELQEMTVELISYLSTTGHPGQNKLLRKFVDRVAQTDVLITFNWDTILDRVLRARKKKIWEPSWGYGRTVRDIVKCCGLRI